MKKYQKIFTYFVFLYLLSGIAESAPTSLAPNHKLAKQIFNTLCDSGVQYPEIAMRQIILETGWLKSPFLMKRNNLFGFRKKEYLRFTDWRESIDYYHKWQKKYFLNSRENYYDFLVRIKYAEARNYIDVLKKISWSEKCKPRDSGGISIQKLK